MIDIDKAQKQILDDLPCKLLDKSEVTNEGVYLLFENIDIQNHLNIDYIFSVFVALSFYQKNRTKMYKTLNEVLTKINSSLNIELNSCKPLARDGNLRIYKLNIQTTIIGN